MGRPAWSRPRLLLHLLPGLLVAAVLLPDLVQDTAAKRALIVRNEQQIANAGIDPALLLAAIVALLYFSAALHQLLIYRRSLEPAGRRRRSN